MKQQHKAYILFGKKNGRIEKKTVTKTFIVYFIFSKSCIKQLFLSDSAALIEFPEQPSRGVPKKRCFENMQKIYCRTPMQKCDFNKVA